MNARWILTVVLAALWLLVAVANASIFLHKQSKENGHSPSMVPLVGGLFAFFAFNACPWPSPYKLWILFLALVLDVGSLPYLLVGMTIAIRYGGRRSLTGNAAASRAVKWVASLLVWMGLLVLLVGAGKWLQLEPPVSDRLYSFYVLIFTPLYWTAFVIWLVRNSPAKR